MRKKLILLVFILLFNSAAYGENDIGNELNSAEYPDTVLEDVAPAQIIKGSVESNVNINLDNCLRLALGNNPRISDAFDEVLASDTRIKQVWANYFPTISWQTSAQHLKQLQLSDAFLANIEFTYYIMGQVSLNQLLYDFGVTQNEATIKKLSYLSAQKTFEETVNDVIYKTKIAYFNLLYAHKKQFVFQSAVDRYQLFYDQARALYKFGMNPKVDVMIAQANLSRAKYDLIQAKNSINLAVAQLNNTMGLPYLKQYEIEEAMVYTPCDISFEEVVTIANNSRPELKKAKIDVENARQAIKLAKKGYFPSLTLQAQYERGGRHWNSNDGYTLGGFLNFPQVNGMLINNQIKEAKYLYDKQLETARSVQNDIYLEIQNSYLKLEEKRIQIPVVTLQLKQAKENYELSNGRYRVGEASPLEVKEAQDTYEESQLEYYTAIYDYNCAKAELEKSIGKNIAKISDFVELKKK